MPGVPYLVMTEQALVTMNESQIYQRVEGIVDKQSDNFTSYSLLQEQVTDGEIVNLATVLYGLEVPEVEVFDGVDWPEAWENMNATFLERQWGDGFPIVAPTPHAVARMLTAHLALSPRK